MDFLTNINLNKNELQNAKIQNLEIEPAPASSTKGQVYFNISENVLKIFNGTSWVPVGTTYDLTSTDKSGGGVNLNLVPGNGSTDTIGIVGSGAVEVTRDNNGNITIGAEHGVDNNTVFTIGSTKNVSSGNSSTVTLTPSDGYGTTTSFNINATGKNTLTTDASGNITINGSQTTLGDLGINQSAANINAAAGSGINATKVSNYDSHLSNTLNPHSVTKTQVGLGNVDNTSDVNKPVSTATQTALNLKANKPTGTVTAGDIATLDANGHLVDSGKKVADLTYTGGDGIAIANNVISVDKGNGLDFSGTSPNKKLVVKPKTNGGIAVTADGVDLTSAVKTSLEKADLAMPKAGGAFAGAVTVLAPDADMNPATKKYVDEGLDDKVDKISGKGLSTNDYTNEEKSLVHGASQAISFDNYQAMVTNLNAAKSTDYNIGQSMYIRTMDVPDIWIYGKEATSSTYTYTTDTAIVNALKTSPYYIQIGYYKIAMLETLKQDLTGFEITTNKKNNIVDNKTSTIYYPSTKAVYDYGETKEASANKKTSVTTYSGSDTYYPTTKAVYTYGETKANKPTGTITANNLAGLDANGNLTDSGFKPSDFNQLYEIPVTQNGDTYSTTKTPTEIYNAFVTDGKELYVTFYITYREGKSRPVYYRFVGTGPTSPIESFIFSAQYALNNNETISDTFTLSALSEESVTIIREIHTLESIANKVTTISSSSTNTQYPSTKAVYDYAKPVDFTVTITRTGTSPNYTYTSDKTPAEILAAREAGKTVVLIDESGVKGPYILERATATEAYFHFSTEDGQGLAYQRYEIAANKSVVYIDRQYEIAQHTVAFTDSGDTITASSDFIPLLNDITEYKAIYNATYDGLIYQVQDISSSRIKFVGVLKDETHVITYPSSGAITHTSMMLQSYIGDVSDEASAGQYISSVSQSGGQISITRADLPITSITSATLTTSTSAQTTATVSCPSGSTIINTFVKNATNDVVVTEVDINSNIATFTAAADTAANQYTCYAVYVK